MQIAARRISIRKVLGATLAAGALAAALGVGLARFGQEQAPVQVAAVCPPCSVGGGAW